MLSLQVQTLETRNCVACALELLSHTCVSHGASTLCTSFAIRLLCFRSYNSKHFCWMCDATLDGNQWFMLGAVSKPFQIEVGVPNFCFATRPLGLALALGTRMTVDIHEAICALLSTKQMLHIVPL